MSETNIKTMAYNRNYNENSNNVSVLFEHVFFEEQTEQSSRRFMIRVLEFNDTRNLSVGFSRQWLAPNGEWVAAKKGHAYFSITVWNQLKAQFGAVSDQIEAFFADGNGAGRMGPAPQGSNVGGSYAPNANTISGGNGDEDVIMPIAASNTTAEQPPAKTNSPPSIFANRTNFNRGGGGNVYRRGGTKRAYGFGQ